MVPLQLATVEYVEARRQDEGSPEMHPETVAMQVSPAVMEAAVQLAVLTVMSRRSLVKAAEQEGPFS
jgi:hypothetical protein